MRTLSELRREHGHCLSSRILKCPDGVSRLVVMGSDYWQILDALLPIGPCSLDEMLDTCLSIAHRAVEEEDWTFDAAFRETFMYYLFRYRENYIMWRDNLANDNRDQDFDHLQPDPS